MSRIGVMAAVWTFSVALTGTAAAQDRGPDPEVVEGVSVVGQVVDRTNGRELPSVRLTLVAEGPGRDSSEVRQWSAETDSTGAFTMEPLRPGRYELRVDALGYAPVQRPIMLAERGVVEVRIEMSPEALDLEPVVVTIARPAWLVEAGFYERRETGMGYTLTRAQIEARNPQRTSDLFYMIPGADVIADRDGYSEAIVLLRGRCQPQVVLDGAPFSAPIPLDQVLSIDELEAVEVYHGSTGPVRYSNSSCGTIMLWSRRGGAGGGPLSWTRILAAAVVLTWITLSTVLH